jgi:AcrR family transcriptional regulator
MLDAAEALLVAEGPAALTTTRVAAAAGVSVGSLYQYLPDKEAIVEALAGRYLTEFEGLMTALAEEASAAPERWQDPVGRLLDAFAQRYRERPGYRALWFGRELTPGLRAADRENKAALAAGLLRVLDTLGIEATQELETAARAGVLVADALLQEAFRSDSRGEAALIGEAKRILRLYLADVASRR